MKLAYKKWLIAIGILLLFILTNPSVSAFKAYLGKDSYQGLKRPLNFFICSIYKDHQRQFFGVLGNFIDMERMEVQPMKDVNVSMETDSTKKDTTRKLTINQFAAKIKSKYPEYNNVDNVTLVKKILEKYPVYKNEVNL